QFKAAQPVAGLVHSLGQDHRLPEEPQWLQLQQQLQQLQSKRVSAGGSSGGLASLLERCYAAEPLRAACERGDLAAVEEGLKQVGPASRAAQFALQASVSSGHHALVRHLLGAGVSSDPPTGPAAEPGVGGSVENGFSGSVSSDVCSYAIQAAMANSPETLKTLAEYGLSLEEVGHTTTLERGIGARAVRVSLATTPLGAAAWSLKLRALDDLASLAAEPKLNELCGERQAVDIEAELRQLGPPHQGGAAAGRLQDFAWAQGATPLMLAVQGAGRCSNSGSDATSEAAAAAVQVLLRHGADPQALNAAGETALHAAARFGLHQVVLKLFQGGADPMLRNAQGDSAEAVAVRAGKKSCADALRTAAHEASAASAIKASVDMPRAGGGNSNRGAAADTAHDLGASPCGLPLTDTALASAALLTALDAERARLERLKEKQRGKKSRQKERQRALRSGAVEAADESAEEDVAEQQQEEPDNAAVCSKAPVVVQLSGDLLLERVSELRRERTRVARQQRQLAKRAEEEQAKAEEGEAALAQLQAQADELRKVLERLRAALSEAETSELRWRLHAEADCKERSDAQVNAVQKADASRFEVACSSERARLSCSVSESEREAGGSDPGRPIESFEAEQVRCVEAEGRRQELEAELEAIAEELRPSLKGLEPPPIFEPGLTTALPRAENAVLLRQLHVQQRRHMTEMRDLVAALGQQIRERDAELNSEVESVLGSGLGNLLAALNKEGIISRYTPISADHARTLRLQAALLK
ncbi:unnamed protein product, partial [Polarella glacialis]